VLAIAGIILVSASAFVPKHAIMQPNAATDLQSFLMNERKVGYGMHQDPWERISATLKFKVHHPSVLAFGDSCIIKADIQIADVKVERVMVGLEGVSSRPVLLSRQILNRKVSEMLREGKVVAHLAAAGATIDPHEGQLIGNRRTVVWTLKPESPGELRGYVYGEWTQDPGDSEAWRGDFDDNAYFSISVSERLITSRNLLAWAAQFLGALLTLPGLIAFIQGAREWRRKKQERRIITEI